MSKSKEIAVPDYLKSMMADGTVQDQTASMQDGAGSVPRLTTKGKTFRFKNGDEEVKAGQSVDVVIVGMNPLHGHAHTYYRDGYTPDASSPPDCSSYDGQFPDPWISNPEHSNCSKCPQQVWGSASSMSGGKAKACKDHKQIFVAKAAEFAKDPDNCTLYLAQVTVNSLKAFGNYGKELASKGFPGPQFVITRLTFDDEASVPKLEFECLGALNEKLGMASHARNTKSEWVRLPTTPSAPKLENKRVLPKTTDLIASSGKDDDEDGTVDVNDMIKNW